jgi:hypothetical protein
MPFRTINKSAHVTDQQHHENRKLLIAQIQGKLPTHRKASCAKPFLSESESDTDSVGFGIRIHVVLVTGLLIERTVSHNINYICGNIKINQS